MKDKDRQQTVEILFSLADNCKKIEGQDAALLIEAIGVAIEAQKETALYQTIVNFLLTSDLPSEAPFIPLNTETAH